MEKSINKPDWILIITIIFQVTLGIAFMYSVSGSHSEQITGNYYSFFHRYLLALLLSFVAAGFVFYYYSSSVVKKYSNWILGAVLFLLLTILIPGVGSMRGARLGLDIGPVFIYFLPFITLLLVMSVSGYIADHYNNNTLLSTHTWKILLVFLAICILILNQPNAKGIVILGTLLIIMCFSAKLYKICALIAVSLFLLTFATAIIEPYMVMRLATFLNPFENFLDTGYQLSMSLSAIGGGNLWGVGFGEGLVNQKLPGAFDGFMFSSVIEETGVRGAFVIILASVIIQWRSFTIARNLLCSNRNFEGLLVIGISSWISLLSIIHMSVNLGIFPTHYVPYPLLSYNHSYLMASLVGFAIIVRIGMTIVPEKCQDSIRLQPASTVLLLLFLLIGFKTVFSAALDSDLSKHYLDRADVIKRAIDKKIRSKKEIPASELRGRITDRYGKVMAKNSPMYDIWVNPTKWKKNHPHWKELMALLSIDEETAHSKVSKFKQQDKKFAYLKRKVDPDIAQQVKKLAIEGVYLHREYYRYYPYGELAAPVIGITDIDDIGQEGLELQFEESLKSNAKTSPDNHELKLSIDMRLQEIAYQELKKVVYNHRAKSGTVVLLNTESGEVLAMVSMPSFYPNKSTYLNLDHIRNRVITDVFEPGGTIIPFTLLSALESQHYTQYSLIDTDPGSINVGAHLIKDETQLGKINLKNILHKTSKVGASQIALKLPENLLSEMLEKIGFGQQTKIELPGERMGRLEKPGFKEEIQQASLSFGYGLSVTSLQLAQAYMLIANNGKAIPVTLLKRSSVPQSKQLVSEFIVDQLRNMLMIDNKNIINGKEDAVQKYTKNGYSKEQLLYVYAGMSSVTTPSHSSPLVVVVTIDEPETIKEGKVTANNISQNLAADIVEKSLRLL